MQTVRIMVFDRLDTYLFDIDPTEVLDATYVETINGENSLTISTSQELEKTNRLLIRDGMGIWHEYVVAGIEETHDGKVYYCIWSLQYDLSATFINGPYDCGIVPGHQSVPQLPHRAMEVSLGSTSRWTIGTITVTSMGAASFYRRSGWEGLQTVIEKWGGELRANITVDSHGIVARAVDLLAHLGTETATRRFDYGFDLKGIKRTVSDDVWPCRIVPLGKAQQTEGGGYTRRPSIASVNDDVMWLEDASAVEETRILSPSGDWEYPTSIVFNDTYEEPADLKAWALEHITEYTRPKVTYEAEVLQFARAGLNAHGVALGDDVVVVDRTFGHGKGLRISARVVKIQGSLLDPTDTALTIGNAKESLSGQLAGVSSRVEALSDVVTRSQTWQATADYLSHLLDRLNGEINATGGYTYITEGEGLRTYDRPVSNPLVGAEANQVVEIKGGNIRIANSRTQAGDWDWKTVLQSGHILADLVTAAKLTAGHIGSAESGNYWDLDSGELRMGATAQVGNRTVTKLLQDVDATITDVDVEYAQNQSATTAPSSGWTTTAPAWREGYYIWQRTSTTTASGTTHSTPVMISGRDGTSGTGIASTTTSYGTSGSASVEPTSWSQTAPTSIPTGQWLWVRTVTAYTDGTSTTAYTKSYAGTNGSDGTSVTILGSYDTLAELQAAHPTGNLGDSYIVAGDLYVWDGDSWENVGQIQGPAGQDGTSVTVSKIEYGTSTSAGTQPSSWSQTVPTSIAAGRWLWVKTTYSDSSTAITKSYVGTDGQDGASVSIQSVTKSGGVTTVKLTDADGTTKTLTINDGEDGENGTAGANGYVHTAWANSADGTTDFSTTVSTNKKYLGVYTDNTAADSTSPSAYSWSLIKGADGSDAYTYTINSTPAALVRDEAGTLTPSSVTFSATRAQGTGTPTAYAGRFKIDEYDGTSWASKYTSSSNESSKSYSPTATAKIVRCTLYLAGGTSTVLDIQSVPIAQDGATGAQGQNGTDGEDAYTVILTNEAHTFAAGTSAAIASTATSYVVAYKGATQVAATIGTITGAPQGMSATIFNNGTTSARFAVSVSNLLTTKQGVLTVPVTVDGKVFSLTFSWSLALSGAKGDKGDKGDTGNNGENGIGVGEIVEQYYLSTSSTTQTGGSWSTTQPAWVSGKYIWTRSKITWTDEQITYTDPILAKAINGANEKAADAQSTADSLDTILNGSNRQMEMFNRLTSNGTIQGLYMSGGQLYVNASYINGGTLVAGGANNANGIIQVKDASGNVISQLDKDGANITGDVVLKKTVDVNASLKHVIRTQVGSIPVTDALWVLISGSNAQGTAVPGLKITNASTTGTDRGYIILYPQGSTYSYERSSMAASKELQLLSNLSGSGGGNIRIGSDRIRFFVFTSSDTGFSQGLELTRTKLNVGTHVSTLSSTISLDVGGTGYVHGTFTAHGTKSRVVNTPDYNDRLLYAYETPAPYFGDIGSATIGEDGLCYVDIDPIFAETARTDMAYQVFLQACGRGELWVSEKHPGYFVVEGTAGLSFDWEVKCHQRDYEMERIEDMSQRDERDSMGQEDVSDILSLYSDEYNYAQQLEALYEEA